MNRTIIYSLLLLLFTACGHSEKGHYSLFDSIEERTVMNASKEYPADELLEGQNLLEIHEGAHLFLIPDRESQIKSFECSECHSVPLDKIQTQGEQKAHWDIKMQHAEDQTMNCFTCHEQSDMNSLHTLTSEKVDFNHSYKLCSQCHSIQYKDWLGGAHGKKIAGWGEPRASMTCVNCHNPHSPHFESRWPTKYNAVKGIERK